MRDARRLFVIDFVILICISFHLANKVGFLFRFRLRRRRRVFRLENILRLTTTCVWRHPNLRSILTHRMSWPFFGGSSLFWDGE